MSNGRQTNDWVVRQRCRGHVAPNPLIQAPHPQALSARHSETLRGSALDFGSFRENLLFNLIPSNSARKFAQMRLVQLGPPLGNLVPVK